MPMKTINNAGQAWSAGATWQLNTDSAASQMTIDMVNAANAVLYTGDLVAVDATGTLATLPAANSSPLCIGVVGEGTNRIYDGGFVPSQLAGSRFDTCGTTNTSGTVTDTSAIASDVGKGVVGPGIPVGAYIVSVTPSTSFVMSIAATATTNPVTLNIGPRPASVGPGWSGIPGSTYQGSPAVAEGQVTPVIMGGWAWVNVGANTIATAGLLLGSVSGSPTANSYTTPGAGTSIAISLEGSAAGLPNPAGNTVIRAWVAKF